MERIQESGLSCSKRPQNPYVAGTLNKSNPSGETIPNTELLGWRIDWAVTGGLREDGSVDPKHVGNVERFERVSNPSQSL